MLTCYLVSDCGHSICGSCQKRQVDQPATRCPVCNVNLVCYIPNIALRNAARELACTCKHCRRQITAETVESHKNECGEIPLQCKTCPEKFPRNQLGFHECPNEITDCTCGARVKRMEMQQHKAHHCSCLPVFCRLLPFSVWVRTCKVFHLFDCCCYWYALSDSTHFKNFCVHSLVELSGRIGRNAMKKNVAWYWHSSNNLAAFFYHVNWWLFNFFHVSKFSTLSHLFFNCSGRGHTLITVCSFLLY